MQVGASIISGWTSQEGTVGLSVVPVDAAGVPAEWVEATVATRGQRTVVWFLSGGTDHLQRVRRRIGAFAAATGARVLTIGCGSDSDPSDAIAIERGLVAYRWLLGEGTDPDGTTSMADPADGWLCKAITASISRFPPPQRGSRCGWDRANSFSPAAAKNVR